MEIIIFSRHYDYDYMLHKVCCLHHNFFERVMKNVRQNQSYWDILYTINIHSMFLI